MSDWKTAHPTWIVGHRGAPRRARENTIASFDFAESFGADAIELDVRQTRDGEAIVFHDDEIVLGTQRLPVRTFTWREIEKLVIPSELGYGDKQQGPIPPNTELTFEVELLDFKSRAEIEQQQAILQQLQQMQQMQVGAPHGEMPGGAMPPGVGPEGAPPPPHP